MNNCQAKRGFFTLYDCPKLAKHQCKKCSRDLCGEHFSQETSYCLECSSSMGNEEATKVNPHTAESYKIRKKHLADKNTRPIYFGNSLNTYYDSYDIRAFDIELSNIADMADSPDEIYFDS